MRSFRALMAVVVLLSMSLLMPVRLAAQADTHTAAELTEMATQAVGRKNYLAAWRSLIELDKKDPEAWKAQQAMVTDTLKNVHQGATKALEEQSPEQALEAAMLLSREDSLALAAKAFPAAQVASLKASLARIQGESYWRIGQKQVNRNEPGRAEASFGRATELLPEDSPFYARLWFDLALTQRDRAALLVQNRDASAAALIVTATESFEKSRDAATGKDEQLRTLAAQQASNLRKFGPSALQAAVATPTPAPTPTPVPGIVDKYIPGNLQAKTVAYFQDVRTNSEKQSQLIAISVAVIGFILLYWVVPHYGLMFIASRYDVHAADYVLKVKRWGIFMLIAYTIYFMRNRTKITEEKVRSGCPHCGYNLEDYYAYEDLVFSQCPKCKGQVTPVTTLEGYIKNLSSVLAGNVEKVNSGAESVEKFVGQDSMVRLTRAIITLGVRRRASDIHIEPDENALVIRQRVDGLLTEMFALPRSLALALVSAIKVQANLNISERRVPQDGKLSLIVDKTNIDIRVASSPASAGEKCTLRLLDVRSVQVEARHLGMSPKAQEIYNRVIASPHGLMLVAGPTGSGKTTTLYVALQQIRPTNRNIISIEDPIEFRIPGVNQIQVNPVAGLTFATTLRSVLRQDPDVIMVGEIRDKETAEISVNSATTGHLVLSTLHTIDASASIARLIDLGVAPRQFADALSLIIAQRLIRLVCQYCTEPIQPAPDQLRELGLEPYMVEGYDFRRGKGCQTCNNTGYYRRSGIFEFLVPSDRLRSAMEHESLSTSDLRELAIQAGMKTLRQEALDMLKKGLTTTEETLRVTK